MCGIVGYIGSKNALPVLLEGLRRLEYRGYDSAGIAVVNNQKNGIKCIKSVGKVVNLEEKINQEEINSHVGIAHTRWATHGKPCTKNSHPHASNNGSIYLVHNGIIENYRELKARLEKKGHKFRSETDSEVVAHLIEEFYEKGRFKEAVQKALSLVKGTYGIAVISKDEPETIIVARSGSPLIVGLGKDEFVIASAASAIIKYTDKVVYLDDGEMAVLFRGDYEITSICNKPIDKEISILDWTQEEAEKQGYDSFMLKEIFEQPKAIEDAIRGRLVVTEGRAKLGGLSDVKDKLRDIEKIIIVSCGTSYYAGLIGEYMIEEYAGIPVEVEYASEFRYRKPILDKGTAVLAISHSGETADTLEAIREAKNKGALTLGIVNTVGSTIARETDAGVYNHAGPEIGVASTKAFTSQLSILVLLTLMLGRQRSMSFVIGERIAKEMSKIPNYINKILESAKDIEKVAKKYAKYGDMMYLARKYNMPIAYEGALKLKEISYVHAEAYPAGEVKHGPIALIDKDFPSFFIAPDDSVYDKTFSGMEEIKARGGKVIAIATKGNKEIEKISDDVIYIPKTLEMLTPLLSIIPLQLFSYYVATARGKDVDKPRNLAKSVTVE